MIGSIFGGQYDPVGQGPLPCGLSDPRKQTNPFRQGWGVLKFPAIEVFMTTPDDTTCFLDIPLDAELASLWDPMSEHQADRSGPAGRGC